MAKKNAVAKMKTMSNMTIPVLQAFLKRKPALTMSLPRIAPPYETDRRSVLPFAQNALHVRQERRLIGVIAAPFLAHKKNPSVMVSSNLTVFSFNA